MEQQQLVDKITHLENQLSKLQNFEFSIRDTFTLAGFFSRKIKNYRERLENSDFNKPFSV